MFDAAVDQCFKITGRTLVEVRERLVMQLDGGRGGGAQHILEWGVLALALQGEAGVLLLEDGQGQHITETQRRRRRHEKPTRTL